MNLELINPGSRWNKVFEELPEFRGKAYYSSDYCLACEANNEGKALALYMRQKDAQAFYPFLLKKIPEEIGGKGCFDIETAYGYGGPAFFNADQHFASLFFEKLGLWAESNNVVAEFVRLNPLTKSETFLESFYQTSLNRRTLSINLAGEFSQILAQCSPPRRRNYRKACKSGLKLELTENLQDFSRLYLETMQRLEADRYYYFSDAYFARLLSLPADNRLFVRVIMPDHTTVAAGIFLHDKSSLHYHLGASNFAYKEFSPASFMILQTAKHAQKLNCEIFHLGGGTDNSNDNSLLRFKTGFSQQMHNFFIGFKIHNPKKYAEFSKNWQQLTSSTDTSRLLHYHYGVSNENL